MTFPSVAWCNPPGGRGLKSRQDSPLAKTWFSLDGRANFGETLGCRDSEIPRPRRMFSPPSQAGFAFLGVVVLQKVDGSIRRESPHHTAVCLKLGFPSSKS